MNDIATLPVADHLRPSNYTAALVQLMRQRQSWVRGARVLDVGCGSGVLLAVAGAAGAQSLTGVDVEPAAVAATTALMDQLGYAKICDIQRGAMFGPIAGQQFDLVLANLPHFPMDSAAIDGRLASWSAGGPDGRRLLNQFLDGLAPHLAPGGRALVMHNAFVGLEVTQQMAHHHGLTVEVAESSLVYLPEAKLAVMSPDVLQREIGCSIHQYGDFAFGTVAVLTITADVLSGDLA